MPNSLRARINRLAYKGVLSRADADRIREALEKQIPKKPIITNYGTVTRCSVCEAIQYQAIPTVDFDYCKRCGQLLDWRKGK